MTAILRLDSLKTWIKNGNQSERLLQHEQGHFDIGHLAMLEFLQLVKQTTFYRLDFRVKVAELFRDVLKKYNEMGLLYDEETQHFRNTKKQKEWDQRLQNELANYLTNN